MISVIRNLLDCLKKRIGVDGLPLGHVDLGVSGPVQIQESETPPKPSRHATGTWIHALVLDFPLIHQNGGTEFKEQNDFLGQSSRSTADTFSGSFDGVQYGLVKRGNDLNVYLILAGAVDKKGAGWK